MNELRDCFIFWIAARLLIERESLLAEAIRVESWNAPWARNRRRRADQLLERAKVMCGDKGLPWGIQD